MSQKKCPPTAVICNHSKSTLRNSNATNCEDQAPIRSKSKGMPEALIGGCAAVGVGLILLAFQDTSMANTDPAKESIGATLVTPTSPEVMIGNSEIERTNNLERVFTLWDKNSINQNNRSLKSSQLIAEGTVLSSAFKLDVDDAHRSPAVYACFKYAETSNGVYNANMDICILDVRHPESHYTLQKNRGKANARDLWASLEEGKFIGEIVNRMAQETDGAESLALETNVISEPSGKPLRSVPTYAMKPVAAAAIGGDFISRYGNNIATQLETASHPACAYLANAIRLIADSSSPEYVRERQLDITIDKAPEICF